MLTGDYPTEGMGWKNFDRRLTGIGQILEAYYPERVGKIIIMVHYYPSVSLNSGRLSEINENYRILIGYFGVVGKSQSH